MTNKSLIIFDMDGLMFDTETLSYRGWHDSLKQLYGRELTLSDYVKCIGLPTDVFKQTICRAFPEVDPDKVYAHSEQMVRETIDRDGVPLKAGLCELLDWLSARGVKKAVATSTHHELAEHVLRRAGVFERFDTVTYGDEIKRSKPFPDLFLKTCELAGESPADSLVLEDSRNGILAAHAADIDSIMVPDLLPCSEELQQLVASCCDDLFAVRSLLEKEQVC